MDQKSPINDFESITYDRVNAPDILHHDMPIYGTIHKIKIILLITVKYRATEDIRLITLELLVLSDPAVTTPGTRCPASIGTL